ncbi:hypothetical protein CF319_g1421 [Tilletia indica]|nr:hypothetical protein CF319_g1421 [Tilletia indica]
MNEPFAGGVEPHHFQLQFFERAKEKNVIICAETGAGKTLVSVLLLRWMLEQEERRRASDATAKKRISVFVVHHVPLVHQQGHYIDANSHLKVEKLYGEMKVDLWKEEEWSRVLSEADVVVSTAQIIKDALGHAFLNLDDLNLIIFDEVHHATKDDVYARIMTSHYHTHASSDRPKIFGMTASPISSKNPQFAKAAVTLENTMDSRILTIPKDGWQTLTKVTFTKATTEIIEYDPPEMPYFSPMCQDVIDKFSAKKKQDSLLKKLDRLGPALGPVLCDYVLDHAVKEGVPDVTTLKALQGLSEAEREHLKHTWNAAVEKAGSLEKKINQLRWSASDHKELKTALKRARENIEKPETRISTKVERLVELLHDVFSSSEEQTGIIFAKEKATVHALAAYIASPSSTLSHITVEALVGHTGPQGYGWKQQESILRNFRRGETRLLIATSVVEEGLDVPACNFVVRFDLPETAIQTIQSRGRARKAHSKMYMMCERGSKRDIKLLADCKGIEIGMREWLQTLTEDRLVSDVDGESDSDEEMGYVPASTDKLVHKGTGAKVEPSDAMSLLNWYVQALPKDMYTPASIAITVEKDEEGPHPLFRCTIRMPARSKLREVSSEWRGSKKAARQEAAFTACKQLYAMGELDNHLLPRKPEKIVSEVIEVKDDEGEVRLLKSHDLPRPIAEIFGTEQATLDARTFWTTILPFGSLDRSDLGGPVAPLLLLTSARPREDQLDVELILPGGPVTVPCRPGQAGTLALSEEQLQLAKVYTLRLLSMVAKREFVPGSSHGSWMVLPLDQSADAEEILVQWDQVSALAAHPAPTFRRASDVEFLGADVAITEVAEITKPPSALHRVREDLQPSSLAPKGTRAFHFSETFQQFHERVTGNTVGGDGPMLEIRSLPRMQNFTTVGSLRVLSTLPIFFMPEVSYVHPVPASVFRAAVLLPSLLDRLNAMSLARECQQAVLKEIPIPQDALLAALTAPSAGLPFSYQKYEFIGDSVLKLIATCHAFVSRIEADEGQLTAHYESMVSNRVLARHSLRLELWRYVCSDAFTNKTWAPPGYLVTDGEDGLTKAQTVKWSAKRLADIVEAILGSAATDTIDHKLTVALQLGVLPAEISSFAGFGATFKARLEDHMPLADTASYGLSTPIMRLMETIQHKFEHPVLAIIATTHSSCMGFELPSYERLEVLGDALLDYFVVEMLQKKYTFFEEGELTIVKANCVNNQTLAALSVSLGLYKYLNHHSSPLSGAISAYVEEVTEERKAELALSNPIPRQYWWTLSPPKALADMVESLLGAVLVDAHFDLDVARAYFDRLYRPFLDKYCRRENAILSSAESLFELLLQRRCVDWHITGADPATTEQTGEDPTTGSTVPMEVDQPKEENRLVRVMVHGQVYGDTKCGDKRFLERIEHAMKMLDAWRSDDPNAPSYGELLETLKELWPWPLRTKKMCTPRLLLEAQCPCRPDMQLVTEEEDEDVAEDGDALKDD